MQGMRLHAAAIPLDRLDHLEAPSKTLHLGLKMMDEARAQDPDPHRLQDAYLKSVVRDTTVASVLDGVHYAARLIAPRRDWSWLKAVNRRGTSILASVPEHS